MHSGSPEREGKQERRHWRTGGIWEADGSAWHWELAAGKMYHTNRSILMPSAGEAGERL